MRVQLFAKLQLLDQRLAALSQTSDALAEQLKEGETIRTLYELRRDRSSQLKHARGRAADLQWELDEIEGRLRELAEQDREGPSDPLLARELVVLREQRNQLEDQALAQMERVEQLVAELTDADSTWHQQSAAWAQREPALRQEREQLGETIEVLQNERRMLRARVPRDALVLYDDLQRRHRGTAIAAVRNRQCSACRARLSAAVFDLLAAPDPLVHCPRCGRVLAAPGDLDEDRSSARTADMEPPDGSS